MRRVYAKPERETQALQRSWRTCPGRTVCVRAAVMRTLLPTLDARIEAVLWQLNELSKQVRLAELELLALRGKTRGGSSSGAVLSSSPWSPRCDKGVEALGHASFDQMMFKVNGTLGAVHLTQTTTSAGSEHKCANLSASAQASARGFLCRRRRTRCLVVLQQNQINMVANLLQTVRLQIMQQNGLDQMIRACRAEYDVRQIRCCFEVWRRDAFAQRKHVDKIRAASLAAIAARNAKYLRKIVRVWHGDCVGSRSTSNSQRRRTELLWAARSRIQMQENRSLSEENLIITGHMVKRQLSRTIYHASRERQVWWCLRHHFHALGRAVRTSASLFELAARHHRVSLYSRCFYPWTEHLHASPYATLDRSRWRKPRCYQARYSQRIVDRFACAHISTCIVKPCWSQWQRHYRAWVSGRILQARNNERALLAQWLRWRRAHARHFDLRFTSVSLWREAGRQLLGRPLRAWYLYARALRLHRIDQRSLVAAHLRARERRLCMKLLRGWHHQAIYGRVEGLYTRAELVRSLAELQAHSRRLEARAESHAVACEEAIKRLDDERSRARRASVRLKDRNTHARRLTLAIHHAHSEVDRIGSAIECTAKLHPAAVRNVLAASSREHDNMVHDQYVHERPLRIPFKSESFLHELASHDNESCLDATNKSKEESSHAPPKKIEAPEQIGLSNADVHREVLMLRARFVLDQACTDFRSFTHFGGRKLYGSDRPVDNVDEDMTAFGCSSHKKNWYSATKDDAVDTVLKMVRDLKEGWQMWDFLVHGNISKLGERYVVAWKDMEGVAIDINAKWASLRANTLSGPHRLLTWGEFCGALRNPDTHSA
mmetsp:Transcript_36713/g.113600  ORF Transcript_36713/g.113600 Transcript_36713/m.113600 type:complete len:832 (+) Transcript_36713:110-2605(+)